MKDLCCKSKFNRNHDALENTRNFWYKKYGKDISLEEARQINERVIKYFRILSKWDRISKQSEKEKSSDGR